MSSQSSAVTHRSILESRPVKIFTDLNCPFCFALHERVRREHLENQVAWCYIEHAPALNSRIMTEDQAALINHEYRVILQRARDIKLIQPHICINTKLAILTLITVELKNPKLGALYRHRLYEAYWQQGLDISDPQVLHEILSSLNIDGLNINEEARRIQHMWQEQWESGNFDHRIPAMQSSTNEVMLGLQHADNIRNFLNRGQSNDVKMGDSCLHHGNYSLAVLKTQELAHRLDKDANGISVKYFNEVEDLINQSKKLPFDGILLDYKMDMTEGYKNIRVIKENIRYGLDKPILYVSHSGNSGEEVHAFALGASDFAQLKEDLSPLIARLKRNLTQARTVSLLHRYAAVDGLTGLLNKREFQQHLEREWRHACRNKLELALIMIDVDHFKLYNDTHGHCAGDDVLRRIAYSLKHTLHRARDIIARFGGEEFIVLLPDTDIKGLNIISENLREGVERLTISHPSSLTGDNVTISMGSCHAKPHPDQTPSQLIHQADLALYQAKKSGRNQFCFTRMNSIDTH